MSPSLPPPWREFLAELDDVFDEPLQFHCIGGFAVVAAYGLPRSTNDLDYFTLIPAIAPGSWSAWRAKVPSLPENIKCMCTMQALRRFLRTTKRGRRSYILDTSKTSGFSFSTLTI